MATREELLQHLWHDVINSNVDQATLQRIISHCRTRPSDPFADTGPAIDRMLSAGVSPEDICLIRREAAYSAVFGTLYSLDDPGVEDDNVFMLHEELLTADPSGMEGRPGSSGAA